VGVVGVAEEPKHLRIILSNNKRATSTTSFPRRFPLAPGYFRYIVLDFSGSIANNNHATINLKSGIRSFF